MALTPEQMSLAALPTDPNLLVARLFTMSEDRWSAGEMELLPLAEKPQQSTGSNFLIFRIVGGRVLARIMDHQLALSSGAAFYVPPFCNYSLRNAGALPARLFFTQVSLVPHGAA
jgi:mannose-6-phosphate isomerase-like protein (cupin superfamily)